MKSLYQMLLAVGYPESQMERHIFQKNAVGNRCCLRCPKAIDMRGGKA